MKAARRLLCVFVGLLFFLKIAILVSAFSGGRESRIQLMGLFAVAPIVLLASVLLIWALMIKPSQNREERIYLRFAITVAAMQFAFAIFG